MADETLHLSYANLMQPICSNLKLRVVGYDKGSQCPTSMSITSNGALKVGASLLFKLMIVPPQTTRRLKFFIIWLAYHLTALESSLSSRQFTRKGNPKPPTPIGSQTALKDTYDCYDRHEADSGIPEGRPHTCQRSTS